MNSRARAALLGLLAVVVPACEPDINDDSTVPAVTRRVSIGPAGQEPNFPSDFPDMSADGRYVVFQSSAGNLVAGDLNGAFDIFRKDLLTGELVLVSASKAGVPGDGDSTDASISADGNLVAFQSAATNLDMDDTDVDARLDVYVKNLTTGDVIHVSQSASGGPPSGTDVDSSTARISPGGRFVVFVSTGEDLDADIFNLLQDKEVFLRDLEDQATHLVSLNDFGEPLGGTCNRPSVSDDGRYVAYETRAALLAGDANFADDIYLRDRQAGTNERISVGLSLDPAGPSINARITPDGRFVIFQSRAPDLVENDVNALEDIFVRDRQGSGSTRRASVGSGGVEAAGDSRNAVLSADGRFAAYVSVAPNLVEGDTNGASDYFWTDLLRGVTRRVTVRTGGAQSTGTLGGAPAITPDGRQVAFVWSGGDLSIGDTNGLPDIFVRGPLY
jgi:Tol biopolymer transport system component